jgi:formyltetrahydrofolate-dependent phosphoribosylglycinamide formyltransferase
MNHGKLSIGILCSYRGSAIDALVEGIESNPHYNISVIMTHREDAPIIEKAKQWNIPRYFVDEKGFTKEQTDDKLSGVFDIYATDLVILVGYMRILTDTFVKKWPTINIHPSLLPNYKGMMDLDVHQAVLDNKDKQTGATLHWVTENVDEGPIIKQITLDVDQNQTAEELKEKVQALESKAFIELFHNPHLIEQWEKSKEAAK